MSTKTSPKTISETLEAYLLNEISKNISSYFRDVITLRAQTPKNSPEKVFDYVINTNFSIDDVRGDSLKTEVKTTFTVISKNHNGSKETYIFEKSETISDSEIEMDKTLKNNKTN
jgi:hypothetical protein